MFIWSCFCLQSFLLWCRQSGMAIFHWARAACGQTVFFLFGVGLEHRVCLTALVMAPLTCVPGFLCIPRCVTLGSSFDVQLGRNFCSIGPTVVDQQVSEVNVKQNLKLLLLLGDSDASKLWMLHCSLSLLASPPITLGPIFTSVLLPPLPFYDSLK